MEKRQRDEKELTYLSDDYSLQKHDCVCSAFTIPFGLSASQRRSSGGAARAPAHVPVLLSTTSSSCLCSSLL